MGKRKHWPLQRAARKAVIIRRGTSWQLEQERWGNLHKTDWECMERILLSTTSSRSHNKWISANDGRWKPKQCDYSSKGKTNFSRAKPNFRRSPRKEWVRTGLWPERPERKASSIMKQDLWCRLIRRLRGGVLLNVKWGSKVWGEKESLK